MSNQCECGATAKYKVESVADCHIVNSILCAKCAEPIIACAPISYKYGFTDELKTRYIVELGLEHLTEPQTENLRQYEKKRKEEAEAVVEKLKVPELSLEQKKARSPVLTEDDYKMQIARNNGPVDGAN